MNLEKVLPPGVNGKITGYLMVKVDEIFWARNSPGDVLVQLQWWGEKDSVFFRPEDITSNEPKKNSDTTVTYNIRTSPGLFESYLRNCGRITFIILRGKNKNVILGTAVVKEIEQIISHKNYHSYFSIFSPKGNRIGDLHICFELTLKHSGTHVTSKKLTENCSKAEPQYIHDTHLIEDQPCNTKSVSSQEDKLLSNILQKGHELRKAMVMSVLADLPIDNLESVVNLNTMKHHSEKEESKLVDFLLGKHMSAEEEVKALKTLRCISPAEDLVEIAKIDREKPKIKCCLHGKECGQEINTKGETMELKLTSASIETNSTSKNTARTEEGLQHIEDETVMKKKKEIKFNCYRVLISSLKLTLDGSRKIFYAPGIKEPMKRNIKFGRNHNPPGTYFILEVTLPTKDGGTWSRSIKFITKNFKGYSIDFSQGTTHRLCGAVTWTRIRSLIIGSVFTVYWRHLNQRVPCPLGSAKIGNLNSQTGVNSVSLCLPLYSNTRLLTGHLNVTISLGILENLREEAVFHVGKETVNSCENPEDLDSLSSKLSEKVSAKPPMSSTKSASPRTCASDDVFPVPSLDEELMRTINLLNSKPDDLQKNPDVEKQEACIQTTLPLTQVDCPTCNHQIPVKEDLMKDEKSPAEENPVKNLEDNNHLKTSHGDITTEKVNTNNLCKECSRPNVKFPCIFQESEISNIPEFENEVIHEFTVKIEKLVGVPLFTGDNDLDCYVDYSFPKVDYNGKMAFDQMTNGTDIQMALREIEFGTVNRHRLRLNCKLTKALISLPVHEITFSVWGRFYRPMPRDYRLGKATLPLMRLSTLELVYCQQRKREPIFEKIVIPVKTVDSSVTSGYKGSFGEIHIILGYSCASSTSYEEWKKKSCEYVSYQRSFPGFARNENNYTEPLYNTNIPQENFEQYKCQENGNKSLFPDKVKPWLKINQGCRINARNGFLNTPDFIQSNFNRKQVVDNKVCDIAKVNVMEENYSEVAKDMKKKKNLTQHQS